MGKTNWFRRIQWGAVLLALAFWAATGTAFAGGGNSNNGNSGQNNGHGNASGNSQGNGNGQGNGNSGNQGNGNSNNQGSGSGNGHGNGNNPPPQNPPGVFHLCIPTQTGCLILSSSTLGMIPTGSSNPTLGITHTGGSTPSFPNLVMGIFVPSQTPSAAGLNFTVNFGSTSVNAALFSSTVWNSGKLFQNYLNIPLAGGGPPAPLSAFLTGTTILQPNTMGYNVYLANLGNVTFPTSSQFTFGLNNFNGFPMGTVFYPWATNAGRTLVLESTPQSSAAVVDTPPTTPVPEPGTLALFGTGLLGLAGLVRRRVRK